MTQNVGTIDRMIRILAGLALVVLALVGLDSSGHWCCGLLHALSVAGAEHLRDRKEDRRVNHRGYS